MAKRIIILDRVDEPSDNSFRYVLWAVVPAARVSAYASATAVSAWRDISALELADLRAGLFTERTDVAHVPAGTTIAQIQAALITRWTAFQAEVTSRNPTQRYGTFWDDTSTWTVAGTA